MASSGCFGPCNCCHKPGGRFPAGRLGEHIRTLVALDADMAGAPQYPDPPRSGDGADSPGRPGRSEFSELKDFPLREGACDLRVVDLVVPAQRSGLLSQDLAKLSDDARQIRAAKVYITRIPPWDVQIFSDGSKLQDGSTGTAAVLYAVGYTLPFTAAHLDETIEVVVV
ncbi:uncharacterized protein BROUX77_005224 [Berkeleyomyces rouxiae]|uniref:uncharacterized protein n=1 Tax=Berkeleyomyces rouxiae TaxID=2035830 RepID=UPI003B7A09E3